MDSPYLSVFKDTMVPGIGGSLLKEACHGVAMEPTLQPITSETFGLASDNKQDGVQLNIMANGFWGGIYERAFFDVGVLNHLFRHSSPTSTYRHHKNLKKRHYKQCTNLES